MKVNQVRRLHIVQPLALWLIAVLIGACDSATARPTAVEQITAFEEFPVVWVGERFDYDGDGAPEMPLRNGAVKRSGPFYDPAGRELRPESVSLSMAYGSCQAKSEQGCPLPLTIVVYPPCQSPPLSEQVKDGRVTVRGVEATIYDGSDLFIETREFTVIVAAVGSTTKESLDLAIRAAERLYGANELAADLAPSDLLSKDLGDAPVCGSDGSPAPPQSPLASGPTLFIDANGAANGSCNQGDSAATVPPGPHTVQVCLAGNTAGNVDALDITITYDDALHAGAPEINCPSAGGGAGCVDDNPNLSDGSAARLGTGWNCTVLGTTQPKADASGPGTGQGQATITCNANVTSPSALLQNGLLATVSLSATAPGIDHVEFGANPATGAPSGIGRQAAEVIDCTSGLTCTGGTITVQ